MKRFQQAGPLEELWQLATNRRDTLPHCSPDEPYWESGPKNLFPASTAETSLSSGVLSLVVGQSDLAKAYLLRSIFHCGIPDHLPILQSPDSRGAFFPATLGKILLCHAYSNWLLGKGIDRQEVADASRNYLKYCSKPNRGWKELREKSSLAMNDYTRAVRTSLIAGDWGLTRQMLKHDFKFKWIHKDEMDLWERLVAEWPKVSLKLRADIEAMFDTIRDPDFDSGMVAHTSATAAFEFAIIRQMYLVAEADPKRDPDPAAVIEAYSR